MYDATIVADDAQTNPAMRQRQTANLDLVEYVTLLSSVQPTDDPDMSTSVPIAADTTPYGISKKHKSSSATTTMNKSAKKVRLQGKRTDTDDNISF